MSKSTVSITLKLNSDGQGGFKELAQDAAGLRKMLEGAVTEAEGFKKSMINWSQTVQALDSVNNIIKGAQSALSGLSETMRGMQREYAMTSQLTGKTGEDMLKLRNSVKATSDQFGTDFSSTMIAVNSLAKGFGITAEEAMKLVQDGFVSGANANGEFVDTLKEYPRYFKEAGLSAEEFIAITTNAAQQGIYSDKGVDVIKEANIRIREMTKSTADALEGIGISAEAVQQDLQNGSLTTFDVMQLVSSKLAELPANSAAVGTAIADIFGGPGEDAGLEYIQSLANVQLSMDAVKASAGAMAEQQEQQLQTTESLKNSVIGLIDVSALWSNVQPYVDLTAQVGMATTSILQLVTAIRTMNIASAKARIVNLANAASAKAVAVASSIWKGVQIALNFVLSANPIGIVVMAIGALVTAVVTAYNNCESFRKICDQVWDAIKPLATAIMDGLAKAFEWLVEKCKEAWEWLKNILGLGNKKVDVAVNVTKTTKSNAPATNFGDKYNSTGGGKGTGGVGIPKVSIPKSVETAAEEEANGLIGKLEKKISDARKDLANAATEGAIQALNESIAKDEAELKRLRELGVKSGEAVKEGVTQATKEVDPSANTLAGYNANIDALNDKLQTASLSEAALINQQIQDWQDKAKAIREAGKEVEKTGKTTDEMLRGSWSGLKGIGSSITGIYESIVGTGNAWEKLTGIVDGFISLYDSFTKVLDIIRSVTTLTEVLTVAKKAEANANVKAAVSGALAANAGIPVVGVGLGSAAAAAILGIMQGIPAFASGGIVSGPTLALVGEYGGASHNPEVIAPLNKLRSMLAPQMGIGSEVEFKIKGRTLVAILDKEYNHNKRS